MPDVPPVIRTNLNDLPEDHRDDMTAWLAALGVDTRWIRPEVTLMPPAAWHGPQLHLSRNLAAEDGTPLIDVNLRSEVTMPLVLDVTDGSWPAWLAGYATAD